MKSSNKKGFIAGVITTLLVMSLAVGAHAATNVKQLEALYSDIGIYLDGEKVTPKDAAGNIVDPFSVSGTTYLPLRAIAETLGLSVEWDGAANAARLSSGKTHDVSGRVLLDSNGIKITYLGVSKMNYGGEEIKLFIENTSSTDYGVQIENLSVNDIMLSPLFSCSVLAGKSAYDSISFYEYMLSDNYITSIDSIEFNFTIFKLSDYITEFQSGVIRIDK